MIEVYLVWIEREQEELAYKQQKKELKEWEPRIYKNRAKENLEFKQEEPPDEQNLASFSNAYENISNFASYLQPFFK